MDIRPRPDLGQILPRPWLRQLAGREPPLAAALQVPAAVDGYLVELDRRDADGAARPGFGIDQAEAVAARVRTALAAGEALAAVHRRPREQGLALLFPG